MAWWKTNRLRLIQNNLREIDADLDVDELIRELISFEANVWMMNAGGIFAFYPSKLEYHYVTPYLRKDLLGEAVRKAHDRGIRFIARFDFSKAHESIFEKRPEWFYRTAAGEAVRYHGVVHTCLNGDYQQEYSLRMIDEVLANYPVDGVFFNMFGYKTTDYSGKEYGICHCGNCRDRFRAMYGLSLPASADPNDPAFEAYRSFQRETTRDMLEKIHGLVKGRNPDVAICTYHPHRVDIVRKESNTALSRPHPVWLYSASENVMTVEHSWAEKLISNCSINAIDLQWRFTSVSEHETAIRLYESMAAGSGLDFCIIGRFEGYPDNTTLETAKRLFRHHRKHEALYAELEPIADVALLKPMGDDKAAMKEYFGIFKMLKEAHVPFKAVELEAVGDDPEALEGVKAIVLPGVQRLTDAQERTLEERRRAGAHLVGTGRALCEAPERLRRLFRASLEGTLTDTDAAYVAIDDRDMFRSVPATREWAIVSGPFALLAYPEGGAAEPRTRVERYLPLVSPSTFGPPERAYGHRVEGVHYGLGVAEPDDGGGAALLYAWEIGALFLRHGYEDHLHALVDALRALSGGAFSLETDAPACVETFLGCLPDGSLLAQFINLSGFNGVTYRAPLPIERIRATVRGPAAAGAAAAHRLDDADGAIALELADGGVRFAVGRLEQYEAVVIRKGGEAT